MLTELPDTDALEFSCDAIAHGVNMKGAMAGGIARSIAIMYPSAEEEYNQFCKDERARLGGVFISNINRGIEGKPQRLYNLFTQIEPGRDARLSALEVSVNRMVDMAIGSGVEVIAMPRIGCGIGGLNWEDVKPILEAASTNISFVVCTL
jgi:O-acetyl-ADP-ribose deacetylase (regulator of RNase III)